MILLSSGSAPAFRLNLCTSPTTSLPACLSSPVLFACRQTEAGHFSIHSGAPFSLVVQHVIDFLHETNGMKHVIAAGHGSPNQDTGDNSADLGARKSDGVREDWETATEL